MISSCRYQFSRIAVFFLLTIIAPGMDFGIPTEGTLILTPRPGTLMRIFPAPRQKT
jgi:hypothetical protein